jgi:hypothetical protein
MRFFWAQRTEIERLISENQKTENKLLETEKRLAISGEC